MAMAAATVGMGFLKENPWVIPVMLIVVALTIAFVFWSVARSCKKGFLHEINDFKKVWGWISILIPIFWPLKIFALLLC